MSNEQALREALTEVQELLINLQPHINQACYPGKAPYIDNYVDPALETIAAALALPASAHGAEPSDAEICELAQATRTAEPGENGYVLPVSFARAVLARWGAPTPPAAPAAQAGADALHELAEQASEAIADIARIWPDVYAKAGKLSRLDEKARAMLAAAPSQPAPAQPDAADAVIDRLIAMTDDEVLRGHDPAEVKARGLRLLGRAEAEAASRRAGLQAFNDHYFKCTPAVTVEQWQMIWRKAVEWAVAKGGEV